MTELRVAMVQVKDVLGITEAAIEPGRVTVISGKNGSTKSSLLSALQAGLAGGNLAKLARVGAKGEPEVVLVLEGPGSESYRVERKGDKVRVRERVGDTAGFEDVPRPQTWLRSLYDPEGSNPVRFLTAADKDRAILLLEALPLEMNRAALLDEMGMEARELAPIPTGLHALEELGLVHENVFRMRTGVNRDLDGKVKAAEQTRRNAPAVIPDSGMAELGRLRGERQALGEEVAAAARQAVADERAALSSARAAHDAVEQRVTAEFRAAAAKRRAAHEQQAAEIRAETERRIAQLAAGLEAAVDELRAADEATLAVADQAHDAATDAARRARSAAEDSIEESRARLTTMDARIAELQAHAEISVKARALHDQAKQFDREAGELKTEADRLTAALLALEAYRRRLASDLPIPGLSIEDRVIRVNGVPWSQLNTAQQIDISVQVASLRAHGQRLPILFVDGAEALDAEHFAALVDRLGSEGIQAFVARVDNAPLRVETVA